MGFASYISKSHQIRAYGRGDIRVRLFGYKKMIKTETCIYPVGATACRQISQELVSGTGQLSDTSRERVKAVQSRSRSFILWTSKTACIVTTDVHTNVPKYVKMKQLHTGMVFVCPNCTHIGIVTQFKPETKYLECQEVKSNNQVYFTIGDTVLLRNNSSHVKHLPMTSHGVIIVRQTTDPLTQGKTLQYLLVRRRFSMSFSDAIRGRYWHMGVDQAMRTYIGQMTVSEREMLYTLPFDQLWTSIWSASKIDLKRREYMRAKRKFAALDLAKYSSVRTPYTTAEAGFPKGRRRSQTESSQACALRELHEETSIEPKTVCLLRDAPLLEEFHASNTMRYKHIYHLAYLMPGSAGEACPLDMDEIGQAFWCDAGEVKGMFRDYDTAKRAVFDKAQLIFRHNSLHL